MKSNIEAGLGKYGEKFFVRHLYAIVTLAAALLAAQAAPPPAGVAPVLLPQGGFSIEGDLFAAVPAGVGDWIANAAEPGRGVLSEDGAPLDASLTFHFVDPFEKELDLTFVGRGYGRGAHKC